MKIFRLHPFALILRGPDDEEQVYRNYRRITCREATARIVPTPPGADKAFSQNRQVIDGTKEKVVAYLSYQQINALRFVGAPILSLTLDSSKIQIKSKN